jgi:hypothetical protein
MAKLRQIPITQADVIEFVEGQSDFGFEIRVLDLLTNEGFHCEHGGVYDDPFTKIPRQYDIRATKRLGPYVFRLAVECKNLKDYNPLLISCIPRTRQESVYCFASVESGRLLRSG